jgi:hypothetical protein
MPSVHWVGFSGSINTEVNDVTDVPDEVTCILCKEWIKHHDGCDN